MPKLILGAILLIILGIIIGNTPVVKNNLSGALLFLGNSISETPKQNLPSVSPSPNLQTLEKQDATPSAIPLTSNTPSSQTTSTGCGTFNRALAKSDGYTDQEIDEYLKQVKAHPELCKKSNNDTSLQDSLSNIQMELMELNKPKYESKNINCTSNTIGEYTDTNCY